MPNVLAMSFDGELAPSFDLRCLELGRTPPDGWGLGYYPAGEPSAVVLKEPLPPNRSIRSELVKAWEHLESSIFVVHIRTARWGAATDANTQPFTRSWGRRDWLFAHAGSLREQPILEKHATFEPIGATDTELVLCELMNRFAEAGWHSLGDVDLRTLRDWLTSLNELGTMSVVLSDGRDVCVWADAREESSLHVWEVIPPYEQLAFGNSELEVDLTRRGVKSRRGVVVASERLEIRGGAKGDWRRLPPGELLAIRHGSIRARVTSAQERLVKHGADGEGLSRSAVTWRRAPRPARAEPKRFDVRHRTVYRYSKPVERSMHLFRLTPVHDRLQSLIRNEIACSVDGESRDYEDVFGNRVRRLVVDTPFTEMVTEATSTVELLDVDPLSYRPLRARTTIPLVWMPWHREVLHPYLLPPELAESELHELIDYAMSFAERNDDDLLETLLDINQTLFRDYQYLQGSTTVLTTPFEVYVNRRGVCQDFTNLFICLARLIGVPARYVCGYLYTGPKDANRAQAEASHAWAQVYLPEVGWKGFDPTNGVLTQTSHIRVAVGRNYRDATPTSGTIYVGGGGEMLQVAVTVEPSPA